MACRSILRLKCCDSFLDFIGASGGGFLSQIGLQFRDRVRDLRLFLVHMRGDQMQKRVVREFDCVRAAAVRNGLVKMLIHHFGVGEQVEFIGLRSTEA